MEDYRLQMERRLASASLADFPNLEIYHRLRLAEFQHERLIHLLVTMTVAISAVILTAAVFITGNPYLAVVDLVLLALLFFYLLHYRKLENGVQSLYRISEKLAGLINVA